MLYITLQIGRGIDPASRAHHAFHSFGFTKLVLRLFGKHSLDTSVGYHSSSYSETCIQSPLRCFVKSNVWAISQELISDERFILYPLRQKTKLPSRQKQDEVFVHSALFVLFAPFADTEPSGVHHAQQK